MHNVALVGYEHPGLMVGYSKDYDVGCLPCMMVAGKTDPTVLPKGWSHTKPLNLVEAFTEHNGRPPTGLELGCIRTAVKKAHHGIEIGRQGEWEFEHGWIAGLMTVAKGRCLTPSEWDNGEAKDYSHFRGRATSAGGRSRVLVGGRVNKWKSEHPSGFFASLGHAFTSVAKAVTHIPVLGSAIKLAATPFDMVAHIVKGERLDHMLLGELKSTVASVKEVAPYVTTVVSFVPGIGTGVAAAIAAGTALVEGKAIDDALMSAVKGALPGGELAEHGFSLALNIAKGKNVAKSALAEARSSLPEAAQKAFDVATALATGRSIQHALISTALEAVHATNIVSQASHALDLGEKLGAQRIIKTTITAAANGNAVAKQALKNLHLAKSFLTDKDRAIAATLVKQAALGNDAAKKMIAATVVTAKRSPHSQEALRYLIEARKHMAHGKAAPHARDPKALHPALAVKAGAPTDGVLIVHVGNKYRLARGKFAHHAKGKLSGVLITRSGKQIHSVPGTYNKG